jgi:hypothetical protein
MKAEINISVKSDDVFLNVKTDDDIYRFFKEISPNLRFRSIFGYEAFSFNSSSFMPRFQYMLAEYKMIINNNAPNMCFLANCHPNNMLSLKFNGMSNIDDIKKYQSISRKYFNDFIKNTVDLYHANKKIILENKHPINGLYYAKDGNMLPILKYEAITA